MIPAVSYLRMSKETQDTSISAQRTAVTALAKAMGYRIVKEYIDSGISGDATEKRVAFLQMLADSATGAFKAILCWDQDRFGRFDLMEAGFWIKPLRDAGVQLVTVAQGKIDWNDFAGRLVYSIQQEAKHQFLRDLSRNINRGKLQATLEGRWMGGAAPYGYCIGEDQHLVPKQPEAATVSDLFKWYASGDSLRAICRRLNSCDVPSPRGKAWSANAVCRIVGNPLYLGRTTFNKRSKGKYTSIAYGVIVPKATSAIVLNDESLWLTIEGTHPPLTTPELFAAAQKAVGVNKKFSGPATTYRVMFRAILKCGWCGGRMGGNFQERLGDSIYTCVNSSMTTKCCLNRTYQRPLMERVKEQLRDQLSPQRIEQIRAELNQRYKSTSHLEPRSVIDSRLRKKEVALTKAKRRLLDVEADMVPIVTIEIRQLTVEIEELKATLVQYDKPKIDPRGIIDEWLDEDIARYKAILASDTTEPSAEMAAMLQGTFSSIRVWSEKANGGFGTGNGAYLFNGRWSIQRIELFPKNIDIPGV